MTVDIMIAATRVQYLGSNNASWEGVRHFFLLPMNPIDTLIGTQCSYLPVYTSSGTNTGSICTKLLCPIPFFGVATMYHKESIIAPLLKMDYLQAFESDYFNPGTITPEQLLRLTGSKNEVEIPKSYVTKVGNGVFMEVILRHLQSLKEFIGHGAFKKYPNLTFLNSEIGINNILGLNLSRIRTYGQYSHTEQAAEQQKQRLRLSLGQHQEDKLQNIIGSPIFNYLKQIVTDYLRIKTEYPEYIVYITK